MEDKTLSPVDALAKLIQYSSITDNNAGWVNDEISKYLGEKSVSNIEDLSEKDQLDLIEKIKSKFVETNSAVPDFFQGIFTGTPAAAVDAATQEEDNTGKVTETVTDKMESESLKKTIKELTDKLESTQAELTAANKKLDVSKMFVKEMDGRLARFESVDVDGLIDLVGKYSEFGTPETLKEKIESASTVQTTEILKPKAESGDKTMTDQTMSQEDKDKLLARYQELGTPEEIEELMEAVSDGEDDSEMDVSERNKKLASKAESSLSELKSYREIGSKDEILEVVGKYAENQMKFESARIAKDLGIDEEKVRKTIDKMESVSEAEIHLKELFGDLTFSKKKDESTDKPAGDGTHKPKHESDERGTVVTAAGTQQLTQLRQICAKL